jgi:3'-phosphoadenosine 5'-phosphosulfate sulfotransferase (PAPS reductase)/FAD synthetase
MSLSDPRHSAADLDISLAPLALSERLAAARALLAGPIVFTTSFGLEDQAITHAIFTSDLDIDIVSLDTGRLFPETYQVWSETEAKYLWFPSFHRSPQDLLRGAQGRAVGESPRGGGRLDHGPAGRTIAEPPEHSILLVRSCLRAD